MTQKNKPVIETTINSAALILTPLGVVMLTQQNLYGLVLVLVGIGLEFFKYWGRKHNFW